MNNRAANHRSKMVQMFIFIFDAINEHVSRDYADFFSVLIDGGKRLLLA